MTSTVLIPAIETIEPGSASLDAFSQEELALIAEKYEPDHAALAEARENRQKKTSEFDRNRNEEPRLIRAWQQDGDARALAKLIRRYTPLVNKYIARTLSGRSVSPSHTEDLRQEAQLALIKTIERFDLSMNTQFSSMAAIYIRTALLRYSLDNRTSVRIGTTSSERKAYYRAQSLRAEKAAAGSTSLNSEDIARIQEDTGASAKTVQIAVSAVYANSSSIDEMAETLEARDAISGLQSEMSRSVAMKTIKELLPDLKERSREVLKASFLQDPPASTQDLARRYSVTPERIGQIRREALTDLSIMLKKRGIRAETCL